MNKIVAIILAVVIALSLSGCFESAVETIKADEQQAAEESNVEPIEESTVKAVNKALKDGEEELLHTFEADKLKNVRERVTKTIGGSFLSTKEMMESVDDGYKYYYIRKNPSNNALRFEVYAESRSLFKERLENFAFDTYFTPLKDLDKIEEAILIAANNFLKDNDLEAQDQCYIDKRGVEYWIGMSNPFYYAPLDMLIENPYSIRSIEPWKEEIGIDFETKNAEIKKLAIDSEETQYSIYYCEVTVDLTTLKKRKGAQ